MDLSTPTLAWTPGILLAAYALGIVYALTAPAKQHDPQRGQAVGCLMIVLVGLGVLGAMLSAGVYWDVRWLVWVPFCVTVFPAFSLTLATVRHLILKANERLRG